MSYARSVPASTDRDSALEFMRVSKTFSGTPPVHALTDVSLSVRSGEIFGLVGESGAGKSTFLSLCVGLDSASSGDVRVLGTSLTGLRERDLQDIRRSIGVVFQGNHLLANMNVRNNVELPLRLAGERNQARVDELLRFVGLHDRANRFPAELSGGEQQRVAIARALMTNPRIVLFDEPTSALDVSTRRDILRLILATRDTFGTTCVLVSHELEAVKAVCDRAALIDRGRLRSIVTVNRSAHDQDRPYLDHAKDFLTE